MGRSVSDQERWQTPPEIWVPLHEEFGFDLDAFADAQTKRLPNYLTDACDVVHYYSGRWHEPDDDEDDYRAPDFWMPLPEAPK